MSPSRGVPPPHLAVPNALRPRLRGNTNAGVNQLQAFQNKVDPMRPSGRISSATAQTLKDAAQRIINQA